MSRAVVLRLLVLLPLTCTVGCSSDNKGKLEGTRWRSYASTVKGIQVPEGFLQLDFERDGRLAYNAGGKNFSGTYTLGPGKQVVLHLEKAVAGRTVHNQTVAIHDGLMKMSDCRVGELEDSV